MRVTKGFGSKGYNRVRISVISNSSTPPTQNLFDYSQQFQYKWTHNYLHSSIIEATPGQPRLIDVGFAQVPVRLPQQGDGVAGVLIADPCVHSRHGASSKFCDYGEEFNTIERTPALINAFVGDNSTDFWGIYGDNWYDRTGAVTAEVFDLISLAAKSKIFTTVPGNHDYWVVGSPLAATVADQCANGHMQYYAQDAKAAESVDAGSNMAPFNFSVDPNSHRHFGLGCNLPHITNHFWYNQIGNIGLVGQSGAYSLVETMPLMKEACTWLGQQQKMDVAVLFGHWDKTGLGASGEMMMPSWYSEMAKLPGCEEFDKRGKLKFVMGHTHCNDPHPHGKVGAGFRVAGFGMKSSECADETRYGIPIVDTTEGKVRFWYFDTGSVERYNEVITCVLKKGWRQCTDLAILWLDEPFSPSSEMVTLV